MQIVYWVILFFMAIIEVDNRFMPSKKQGKHLSESMEMLVLFTIISMLVLICN